MPDGGTRFYYSTEMSVCSSVFVYLTPRDDEGELNNILIHLRRFITPLFRSKSKKLKSGKSELRYCSNLQNLSATSCLWVCECISELSLQKCDVATVLTSHITHTHSDTHLHTRRCEPGVITDTQPTEHFCRSC